MEPQDLDATTWSVIRAFDVPPNAPAILALSGGRPSLYHQWSLPPWPAAVAGLRCTTDRPAALTRRVGWPSLYHHKDLNLMMSLYVGLEEGVAVRNHGAGRALTWLRPGGPACDPLTVVAAFCGAMLVLCS